MNLYAMTRGINRFQGLYRALAEIAEKYTPIDGLEELRDWVELTPELSNEAPAAGNQEDGQLYFEKALRWSEEVNQGIHALDGKKSCPFPA